MPKKFLDHLVQTRFSNKKDVRELLDRRKRQVRRFKRRNPNKYIQGVHNGVFYRIKVPPEKKILPDLPKLRSPQAPPKPLEPLEAPAKTAWSEWSWTEFSERLQDWWRQNWPILVLNFGSFCTLLGFTRSDVLELRALAATGSLSSVAYFFTLTPLRFTPIVWSSTFAAVNITKILQILQERKGTVHLSAEEERVYIDFFMPHGVTPKQYEAIRRSAKVLRIPKGELIIKKGDKLEYVYLVVKGSTRANILGRHLSAVSMKPKSAGQVQRGGASGAWIGEMAFLETFWIKEQQKHRPAKNGKSHEAAGPAPASNTFVTQPLGPLLARARSGKKDKTATENRQPNWYEMADGDTSKKPVTLQTLQEQPTLKPKVGESLYTIVAYEDCTVLRWSHKDMEKLMERSTDLRGALTRTMSANIVGKVINLTVSRSTAIPTWSAWLDDWKYSGEGVQVHVESREEYEVEDENDEKATTPPPSTREYAVKKFGPKR